MTQITDPIIQTKICPVSGEEFTLTQGDLDFYNKISPTFAGQKFQIPTPTLCPEERQRRRLSFRNERNLYRRTCDASGKQIISIYSPDKAYKIYDQKIRRSDSRDAMGYGRDFDFSKTFAENFKELMLEVPRIGMLSIGSEGCEYAQFNNSKNCYLSFVGGRNENILYSHRVVQSKNSLDLYRGYNCDYCYECISCTGLSLSQYNKYCKNSNYIYFCIDCNGCSDCFMCSGLVNQQFMISNQQYTKEGYKEKIQNLLKNKQEQKKIYCDSISNYYLIDTNINCEEVLGTFLDNCNKCYNCNYLTGAKHCKFCSDNVSGYEECYDISYGTDADRCFDSLMISGFNNYFSTFCLSSQNSRLFYSDNCYTSSNLFGCIGLRDKSYCIFNKQYTKEEYEIQVAKIITHMQSTGERGEFFHPSLSPFGYNETVAQEYYPLVKGELESAGYHRSDYESPKPISDKVIQGKDLPETIKEVQDDILQYAISCEVTGKLFKLQKVELEFYRKHNLPVPRKHPDQRHLERLALRK